ncbi:type II secretory pathway component PulM [Variovorax sp. GrIS 2.14]|uniref:hypothetical protein n=1 Tax=Variovorax sp. GrIS 2.14 TaxID=3071709 RepID=UPI0038F80CF6
MDALVDSHEEVEAVLAGLLRPLERRTEQSKQSAQEALHVAERVTQAEADRDQERREAGQPSEEAARLQGMVQAMTGQNAQPLCEVAGGTGTAASGPGKKKEQ